MINRTTYANERLLTTEEMAAILKIAVNTVHSRVWQKRNGCPLIKIGKRSYAVETTFWKWVGERGLIKDGETR